MADSDMIIVWPNEDGSTTLSQRDASGHVMPSLDRDITRVATLSPGSTSVRIGYPILPFVPVLMHNTARRL